MLSLVSWIAIAVMLAAVTAAATRRFMASGALLLANLAVFAIQIVGGNSHILGSDPASLYGQWWYPTIQAELALYSPTLYAYEPVGFLQIFTSMFVHADLWHLLGNVIVLWAFGMPFEERVGPRKFLLIYLVAGLGAVAGQLWWNGDAPSLMLGASGAIFGILGAFAVRHPNQVIQVPVPLFIILMRFPLRVVVGVFIYVAYGVFYVIYGLYKGDPLMSGVAHFAHFGGLLVGAALAFLVPKEERSARTPVDLDSFKPFARDSATQSVLVQMKQNHDEPAVFQAWLDRFFRSASCPTCGGKVMPHHGGAVVCTQGHRFDVRKKATPSP